MSISFGNIIYLKPPKNVNVKESYHHVQIIHVHPILRVQPTLVAHKRLRGYQFDKVRINIPICVVPVRTASGLVEQTLKHRFHWFNIWCV